MAEKKGVLPPADANEFVAAVLSKGEQALRVPLLAHGDGARMVQKLTGLLAQAVTDSPTRRLFTDESLVEGVDVPVEAIRYWQRLEPSHKDGLERDVLWVDPEADLTYWSKQSCRCSPQGGNAVPRNVTRAGA